MKKLLSIVALSLCSMVSAQAAVVLIGAPGTSDISASDAKKLFLGKEKKRKHKITPKKNIKAKNTTKTKKENKKKKKPGKKKKQKRTKIKKKKIKN